MMNFLSKDAGDRKIRVPPMDTVRLRIILGRVLGFVDIRKKNNGGPVIPILFLSGRIQSRKF